jgi:thioredoxin 1
MATSTLTHDKLDDLLAHNDIVLIDFFTDWCGPCKVFAPVFEEASEKHPDVKFAKCNTEQEQQLAAVFGVRSIPTLAVFRQKVLLFLQPGAMPSGALEDLISQVKSLNMDEVRDSIEKERLAQEN